MLKICPGKTIGFSGWLALIIFLIAACQTQPNQIFIEVDGRRQSLTTEAETVREALDEADITLSPVDRVSPDLYAQLEPGLVIVVTRVAEEVEVTREIIPFARQTVVNEALASGETRLAQLGVNGEDEISIRILYENGKEVSRTEISRVTIIEPVQEILVVGRQGSPQSIPIDGTIAYLSNGNAWLMRNRSGSRRALTVEGNLDGRVFELSPDGRQLLYTTHLTHEIELPLNQLWLAPTTIVGESPITLSVQSLLQAAWSPVVSQTLIAYSTGERTATPPGWRANNDLWLLDVSDLSNKPLELLPPNTQGLYPWWGTSFTWSPNGAYLAYARADQIGVIRPESLSYTISSDNVIPLVNFAPLQTFSDWVWVPQLSWSPDSRFIAATVHGPPLASETEEESQVFDLWLYNVDGTISARVAEQVGMWANPSWGPSGIAYGEADNPLQSANSRYDIYLIDRDGSNRRQIFPFREELGVQLPDITWSPDGQNLLFSYNGNLFITSHNGGLPKQLTTDGQASHPRWVVEATGGISATLTLSGTQSLDNHQTITGGTISTGTNSAASTPASEPDRAATPITTPTPVVRDDPTGSTPTPSGTAPATPTSTATELSLTPTITPGSAGSVIEPTGTITATAILTR